MVCSSISHLPARPIADFPLRCGKHMRFLGFCRRGGKRVSRQTGKGSHRRREASPFRVPRSIEEGRTILRETPEAMREKARERRAKLPEPARKAIDVAGAVAGLAMIPVRFGWNVAADLVRVPVAMFRVLRQRES